MDDAIDTQARQVRIDAPRDDLPVHRLAADWVDPWSGKCYRTVCAKVLTAEEGAMLTVLAATCARCLAGGA